MKITSLIPLLILLTMLQTPNADASCNLFGFVRNLFSAKQELTTAQKSLVQELRLKQTHPQATNEELIQTLRLYQSCQKDPHLCGQVFASEKTKRASELYELHRLMKTSPEQVDQWATTPDRITYAYKILPNHPEQARQIIEKLKTLPALREVKSPQFNPETLLTYSYEKEGKEAKISFFYKLNDYTDDQWLDLPEDVRLDKLFTAGEKKKTIVGTQFKPKSLGDFGLELDQIRDRAVVGNVRAFEVKHHNFELSLKDHLKAVSQIGNEMDYSNLHTHIVFELPPSYPENSKKAFLNWVKHKNDYVFFKGLEEGLHPNWLTRAASQEKVSGKILQNKLQFLVSDLRHISETNQKFMGFALRAGIYGNPIHPKSMKIGIEIRDVSRKKEVYEKFVSFTSEGITNEHWVNTPAPGAKSFTFDIERTTGTQALQSLGIEPVFAEKMWNTNPFVGLPFNEFEKGKFLDHVKGGWTQASESQIQAIEKAKTTYIKAMQDLAEEYKTLLARGTPVTDEEIDTVIKMCLGDWAKQSKISELYSK